MSRAPRRSAGALLLVGAAALLAACGESSSTGVLRPPIQATHTVPSSPRLVASDTAISNRTGPVKALQPAGLKNDGEVSSAGGKPLNPCTLVTRAQAQAILGKPVGQPVEAPLGPTCIYRPQGAKAFVTLAVESTIYPTVKPQTQLRARRSVAVGSRSAYCGFAGAPTMIVPLGRSRFLTVVAPCPIAASFAAKALGRVGR